MYQKICCICLDNTKPVSNVDEEHFKFFNDLKFNVPKTLINNDYFVLSICEVCTHELEAAHWFMKTCETNLPLLEKSVAEFIKRTKKNKQSIQPVEQRERNEQFDAEKEITKNKECTDKQREMNEEQFNFETDKVGNEVTDEHNYSLHPSPFLCSIKVEKKDEEPQFVEAEDNIIHYFVSDTQIENVNDEDPLLIRTDCNTNIDVENTNNLVIINEDEGTDSSLGSFILENDISAEINFTDLSNNLKYSYSNPIRKLKSVLKLNAKDPLLLSKNEISIINVSNTSQNLNNSSGSNKRKQNFDTEKVEDRLLFCEDEFTMNKYNTDDINDKGDSYPDTISLIYICDVCKSRFDTLDDLENHVNMKSCTKKTKCQLCKETFSNFGAIKRHLLLAHKDVKPFKCTVCPKSFLKQCTLSNHISKHNSPKPYCSICGKTFTTKHNLNSHLLMHQWKNF